MKRLLEKDIFDTMIAYGVSIKVLNYDDVSILEIVKAYHLLHLQYDEKWF